jgi:hypothetical protein
MLHVLLSKGLQHSPAAVHSSTSVATSSAAARSSSTSSSRSRSAQFLSLSAIAHALTPYPSQVDAANQPIPAHANTLWEVEVRNVTPARNTPDAPLSATVEQVLAVQLLMKGLLDLRRQDA